ncbi:transmembrane protein 179 [Neocloeon triangulifer]|uniref:transmembrane protein 179 n=1 Tax=Neocloeon triangulifer TaxID=2078957 RepID=UPI00286F8E61|nr:transmembrane protein 179 [Neocloeon triangulifer]
MELTNILLLSQIAGYSVALTLSFCLAVPMSLHQNDFKGHCLLFSTGKWQETDGQFNVTWASTGFCSYPIALAVLVFGICVIQLYRMSVFYYRGTDSSFLSAFIDVVVSIAMCLLNLASALIVTLGFITWCRDMTERFPSCEIAAGNNIDQKDEINTINFYIQMGTAQFGAWALWASWVGLAVLAMVKLCQYHQMENVRVSMYIERQRLINEGQN